MRLIIDGDGCPVIPECLKIAKKYKLSCVIFCDTSHQIQREGATTIVVDKGADSVDFALVNFLKAGDIVVTQDYGLAAMCLGRNARAIHQDGMIYDAENIDSLLLARHTAQKIRKGGGRLHGAKKRTSQQNECFFVKLEGLVQVKP